jgi:hypothetical protein
MPSKNLQKLSRFQCDSDYTTTEEFFDQIRILFYQQLTFNS